VKRITITSPTKTEHGRLMPGDTPTVADDLAAELEGLGVAVIDGDADDGAPGSGGGADTSAPPAGTNQPAAGLAPAAKGRGKAGKQGAR
jgi:hypothetical protein